MIKKLKKAGTDGLMVYFTKEEKENYGLVEGDIIEIPDMLRQKSKKEVKKKCK